MRSLALIISLFVVVLPFEASGRTGPPGLTRIDPPAAEGALAPNLMVAGDAVFLTWLEPSDSPTEPGTFEGGTVYRLRYAKLADGAWSRPVTIVQRADFFANWADIPSMAQASDGTLVVHWLQRSGEDTYAYDVMLARSTDGGKTWRTLGPPHHDRTQTEHGFVSLVREADGVRAFWLDGREMASGDDSSQEAGGLGSGNMTLRTAFIRDSIGRGVPLDDRVCECCSTSAAMTANGPVIVYRDRSADEVRDISIVRRLGEKWTKPQTVHADGWRIAGCPVNGPALDARGQLVVVAWYTAAVNHGVVRAAFSADGGGTFYDPMTVDDTWPLGRVQVLMDDSGDAIVSWLDTGDAGGAIMLRRVAQDGRMGAPVKVAAADLGRASGFPKMVRVGATLLVVWTHDGETTRLRGVSFLADDIPAVTAAPRS